jgi:acetyl esterase
MRIFEPSCGGPVPTMICVHGGAWSSGGRNTNAELCGELAARGILMATLDIRHQPKGGYPAPMEDINVGVRYLKAHASEFGGTSRIGGMGTSSGGHQVVLCGMQPERYADLPGEPGVDASFAYVIAGWPVIDPLYRYQVLKAADSSYHPQRDSYIKFHDQFWGSEAAMAEGSPQVLLDQGVEELRTPPLQLLQREVDALHPREMQERFIASYRAAGGEAELVLFPDIPSPFKLDGDGYKVVDAIADFVNRHA